MLVQRHFYQHAESRRAYLPDFYQLGRFYYRIANVDVELPLSFSGMQLAGSVYLVKASIAQHWIKTKGLQLARPWPGKAILILSGLKYARVNSAGISFCVYQSVRQRRWPLFGFLWALLRRDLAIYTHYLPTSVSFAAKAGCCIWGLPQWQERVEFKQRGGSLVLTVGNQSHSLWQSNTAIGGSLAHQGKLQHMAYSGGCLYQASVEYQFEGLKLDLWGDKPELGQHPLAHWLYNLGLSKRPLLTFSTTALNLELKAPDVLPV